MKITKAEIRQIINEELEVILTNEEVSEIFGEDVSQQLSTDVKDKEGAMAIRQLNNIGMMSGDILDLVDDSDNLDEWVEAKIVKAHDYLNTVHNYLRGESIEHVSLNESPESDALFAEFEAALQKLRDIAQDLPPDHLGLLAAQTSAMADKLDNTDAKTRPPLPPADDDELALKLPNPMSQRDPKYGHRLTSKQWINRQRSKVANENQQK